MTLHRLVVEVPVRPFSLNAERQKGRWDRSDRTKIVKTLAKVHASAVMPPAPRPLFHRVEIVCEPYALDRRFRQDIGNCMPTVKACIDGLVLAGVIKDDDDKHLTLLSMKPHQFGRDAMVLTVIGELYDPAKGGDVVILAPLFDA